MQVLQAPLQTFQPLRSGFLLFFLSLTAADALLQLLFRPLPADVQCPRLVFPQNIPGKLLPIDTVILLLLPVIRFRLTFQGSLSGCLFPERLLIPGQLLLFCRRLRTHGPVLLPVFPVSGIILCKRPFIISVQRSADPVPLRRKIRFLLPGYLDPLPDLQKLRPDL